MANLKLGKLPTRSPSKITITVSSDLSQALDDYAVLYRQTYGESETVAELIPYMLAGFLEGDRAFAKARKEGLSGASASERPRRQSASRSDNA